MIRKCSGALLFVACCAAAAGAGAQEALAAFQTDPGERITLAEALRLLEENNLELRLARSEVAAAEARVRSAGAVPNPDLFVSREQLSGGLDGYEETIVTIGQPLEIGGQRRARRESARRSAEAVAVALEAERSRLVFAVYEAYIRAARAEAHLAILREATGVVRSVEETGRVRFAEGDLSLFDRNRLRIERSRYEALLATGRLELDDATRELAILIAPGSMTGTILLPVEPLTDLTITDATLSLKAAQAAASGRAEVRAADLEVDAALVALSLARRERIPDLTVVGGYKAQGDGFLGAVLGISFPVPLWNRNEGRIAVAQAALDGAVARREIVEARARADIRRAWDTHTSLRERMRTLGDTLLAETGGMLETARVAYAEGEMSLLELLDATNAHRSARESLNELLGDYLIAAYDLRRATGRILEPMPTTSAANFQ